MITSDNLDVDSLIHKAIGEVQGTFFLLFVQTIFKLSVAPSAPVPSSRPTLKDYMNAGGVPRPSVPGGIPYPGYINPATSSNQGYQQPPNPATTSHQGYQQPPMMYQQAQPQARFQPPTTSQSYQVDFLN